jgi:hypothetical protein
MRPGTGDYPREWRELRKANCFAAFSVRRHPLVGPFVAASSGSRLLLEPIMACLLLCAVAASLRPSVRFSTVL